MFEKLLNIAGTVVMYVAVYFIIGLCWIGAEYLFEGAVHSSMVDGWFCFYLTCYVVRDLKRLEDKLAERRADE